MDELDRINEVDAVETRKIQRMAAGILEKRPWVWLRWSKVGGVWTLVPQISLEGAYELRRRLAPDTMIYLEQINSFTTPKGVPVISIIVSLEKEVTRSDGVLTRVTLALGGQDGFIVQAAENEERKMHGTAAALHKAIRNCIINYVLLHHGTDVLFEFVDEAIRLGRAAILEKDGTYRFVSPEELGKSGKPKEEEEPEETTKVETPTPQTQGPKTGKHILQQLSNLPPETLNQYLLIYSEIIQKDPHIFGENEWADFVKWVKSPITQREIDDLVQQASILYRREMGLPPNQQVDRREVFRYIARNFMERGQRLTELTQPQYHLLRQKIQSKIWETMQVLPPEDEDVADVEVTEEEEGKEEDVLDEFPF